MAGQLTKRAANPAATPVSSCPQSARRLSHTVPSSPRARCTRPCRRLDRPSSLAGRASRTRAGDVVRRGTRDDGRELDGERGVPALMLAHLHAVDWRVRLAHLRVAEEDPLACPALGCGDAALIPADIGAVADAGEWRAPRERQEDGARRAERIIEPTRPFPHIGAVEPELPAGIQVDPVGALRPREFCSKIARFAGVFGNGEQTFRSRQLRRWGDSRRLKNPSSPRHWRVCRLCRGRKMFGPGRASRATSPAP